MTTIVSAGTNSVAGTNTTSTTSSTLTTPLSENNTEFRLDYIKDGEPLSGYRSEQNVGVLNRTSNQLFQLIQFLQLEVQELKNVSSNQVPTPTTENTEGIQELENQISTLTRVLGEKVSSQDTKIHTMEKVIESIQRQRPTNFLDYQMVRSLENLVNQLEAKVFDIENKKLNSSQEVISSGISEEQLAPINARLILIDARVRNLIDDIGVYDSEQNTGSGLKNRVHQLYLLATDTKRLLDSQIEQLSPAQEQKIADILETQLFEYKRKVNQTESISREINARVQNQERTLTEFISKNRVSDQVLEGQTLSELLASVKTNTQTALQNAQNALSGNSQQVTKVEALEESMGRLETELTGVNARTQEIGRVLSTLSDVIGKPGQENTVLGALSEIETLKSEFSENIQNINMIIGQNVPGQETGFYRLLNEAKVNRNPYYTIRISESLAANEYINIRLPEYIYTKGNSFIVRNKNTFEYLNFNYDIQTKQLEIDIRYINSENSEFELLILPIQIEQMQIDNSNIIGIIGNSGIVE